MRKRLIECLFGLNLLLPSLAAVGAEAPAAPPPPDAPRAEIDAWNCAAARRNLEALTTAVRRRIVGPDGVAYHMTEEERQQKIDEAKAKIAESCK